MYISKQKTYLYVDVILEGLAVGTDSTEPEKQDFFGTKPAAAGGWWGAGGQGLRQVTTILFLAKS